MASKLLNRSIKKVDNHEEKKDFADLVKDAMSVGGFLLSANFESD